MSLEAAHANEARLLKYLEVRGDAIVGLRDPFKVEEALQGV